MRTICGTILVAGVLPFAGAAAIDISTGRQLFVDDFLVEATTNVAPEGWGSGKWDAGYLSPVGGICVIKDERLLFYNSGLRGDLAALAGRPVRFRFRLHCGTLYSFWVSSSERGESRGYVAGGGPAYHGLRDLQ